MIEGHPSDLELTWLMCLLDNLHQRSMPSDTAIRTLVGPLLLVRMFATNMTGTLLRCAAACRTVREAHLKQNRYNCVRVRLCGIAGSTGIELSTATAHLPIAAFILWQGAAPQAALSRSSAQIAGSEQVFGSEFSFFICVDCMLMCNAV